MNFAAKYTNGSSLEKDRSPRRRSGPMSFLHPPRIGASRRWRHASGRVQSFADTHTRI
jgi:hypothetical protein